MEITRLTAAHVEDAAALVLDGYRAEREAVRVLPFQDGYRGMFAQNIAGLADNQSGIESFAAVERGRLAGFLAGYPAGVLFSSYNGVYVPLFGHAASGNDKRLVYQRLYTAASGAWVRDGRPMHAASFFAHDRVVLDAWFWLGFGLRCVDAIRPLSAVDAGGAVKLDIRKATAEDADKLFPLHAEHCAYYATPPLFMPDVEMEHGAEEFKCWLGEKDHHQWAAYADGKPVSYMRVRHDGETFVAGEPDTINICGAYTRPDFRGTGVGAALLQAVMAWAKERGYARLGVDYESFNVMGSRFWMKHFTPFMLSAVRFIDDRNLK